MLTLHAAWQGIVVLGICFVIWHNHETGRIAGIGPERRYAPVSFWLAQLFFAAIALVWIARLLIRL